VGTRKFKWDLKSPIWDLTPFENYEEFLEWQQCGECGCNA